jgi:hypothetical protein
MSEPPRRDSGVIWSWCVLLSLAVVVGVVPLVFAFGVACLWHGISCTGGGDRAL